MRFGDLTYTAWQTLSTTGRLSGTLVCPKDSNVPDAALEVTLRRGHASFSLRSANIGPSVGRAVPMALTEAVSDGVWHGLRTVFEGPESEASWWLLLAPAYHHGE